MKHSGKSFLALLLSTSVVFGFSQNATLTALADNTALDLGQYTCDQPTDAPSGCGTILDYGGFVYDKFNHQMLMFGGGHAATARTDVSVFDFNTLTWASAYPSTLCSEMTQANYDTIKGCWISTQQPVCRHTYDEMVVTENTREFLILTYNFEQGNCIGWKDAAVAAGWNYGMSVAHYNPVAKTWTYGAPIPWRYSGGWFFYAQAEYDPVSGMVIVLSDHGMWIYDPVQKVISRAINSSLPILMSQNLVYFPPNQKMYQMQQDGLVYEVNLNRTDFSQSTVTLVTGITGTPPNTSGTFYSDETGFDYDSTNQVIGGGIKDAVFYAFDPIAKTWSSQTMNLVSSAGNTIPFISFHGFRYDPVDNVYILVTRRPYNSAGFTWAYRYKTPPAGTEEARAQAVFASMVRVSPNPFNSAVEISFNAGWKDAQVSVYSASGKKIADLTSQARNGSVSWRPAAGVPMGIYFLHLKADSRSFTRKIVLAK